MKRILGTVLASLLLAAGACNNAAQVVPVVEGQPVTARVNPGESLRGMDNEFAFFDSNIIDAHFPPEQGAATASVILTPLNLHRDGEERITTEEAQKRMAALRSPDAPQGFRPATIREGRAFAKANPEFQRQFSVVALGSSWVDLRGYRSVPCFNGWDGERGLDLCWTDDYDWGVGWRFLAVRK